MASILDFVNKKYAFHNLSGTNFLGEIIFLPNGKIGQYDNPNERSWTFEDGCLIVWGENKGCQAKYTEAWKDGAGKWNLVAYWDPQGGNNHHLTEL